MRLDHLLSKEHLPAKAGEEPAAPGCGVGVLDGGDTGESSPTTAIRGLVQPPFSFGGWVGGNGIGVRLVVAVNTLLGPEKTNACLRVVGVFSVTIITRIRTAFRGDVCWFVVVVVVCLLRIAQWMRASFLCSPVTTSFRGGCVVCGQVAEGTWWMPWHQEPMKDVGGRDRPGGVVNRAVIPGCPNGGTQHQSCGVTCA